MRIINAVSLQLTLFIAAMLHLGQARTFANESSGIIASTIGDQFVTVIRAALDEESLLGAQLAIGTREELVLSQQFGVVVPGGEEVVDRHTLFCIGSCSKPLASACVMTLVDDGTLSLDDTVDKWVDGFSELRDQSGQVVNRAPTVRELLAHRGGIYSQRRKLSPIQTRAIRDFRLSLEESIAIIAKQPLIATPGESFDYSGAGYCLLGRVAEKASTLSIDQLLQTRLCGPLKLTRTSYFPSSEDKNVANGGMIKNGLVVPHPASPHVLGKKLRFPLVGGSIYSTAEETAELARLILNKGQCGTQRVLSANAWSALTRRHFDGKSYGLGWSLPQVRNGQNISMIHNGALYSYRSLLFVSLADEYYVVAHWTLPDPGVQDVRDQLTQIVLRQGQPGGGKHSEE